ncbi:hypothetical protein IAQ61_003339 [Plenodomus lingam]|uniref:uncharacterized protein n=1 Tax=Leptosphaeria maculans TaxID=5022 RepID=UPI003318D583|nr:hypothetical protein IAQ61_003339 [Plenodomus lingam]
MSGNELQRGANSRSAGWQLCLHKLRLRPEVSRLARTQRVEIQCGYEGNQRKFQKHWRGVRHCSRWGTDTDQGKGTGTIDTIVISNAKSESCFVSFAFRNKLSGNGPPL